MSKPHTPRIDFCKYFALKQRAYLINISEGRDEEQYKSISGIIVGCNDDFISLQIPYATGQECIDSSARETTYKLTTESMGSGIQIIADLVSVSPSNEFNLKLRGNMEMYQRRQMPRIDTIINMFQIRRDTSLSVYRKEFRRIMDSMKIKGVRPNLKLQETPVNLGAGGICVSIEALEPVSKLSMFFLDLDTNLPLVCAVAELVWSRLENDRQVCGYRFMQIHKADQERIIRYVQSLQKKRGITTSASKAYWELLDRMSNVELEKEQ